MNGISGNFPSNAYLWITVAGTSNGKCTRGAEAPDGGDWWGELALERARLATPPLG